jgi:hypothetical protein
MKCQEDGENWAVVNTEINPQAEFLDLLSDYQFLKKHSVLGVSLV